MLLYLYTTLIALDNCYDPVRKPDALAAKLLDENPLITMAW